MVSIVMDTTKSISRRQGRLREESLKEDGAQTKDVHEGHFLYCYSFLLGRPAFLERISRPNNFSKFLINPSLPRGGLP